MAKQAIFSGLVFDEQDRVVSTNTIGGESFYIVDDNGFKRHIPSEDIDKPMMKLFTDQVEGNEDLLADQAAKMTGQDDLFSVAIFKNQMKNLDKEIESLYNTGLPEEAKSFMGMMGLKITIDVHGDIVNVNMPSREDNGGL